MKRRLVWVGAAICAVVLCLAYLFYAQPDPICEANAQRIQLGMSLAEVEAIIGCPPGDYTTETIHTDVDVEECELERPESWHGDQGSITIWTDRCGRVYRFGFSHGFPSTPRMTDRVRYWLGW